MQWATDESLAHSDQAALDALPAEPISIDDKHLQIVGLHDQGEETYYLSTAQRNKQMQYQDNRLTALII